MSQAEAFRELETAYADLERELGELRPLCRQSSRCCRFKDFDHQLWTTGLELDWLLAGEALPETIPDGVCPYLKNGLCGARGRRMLGCRVFFCDPGYKDAMNPLYERYHARIKEIHRRFGLAYEYRELLAALAARKQEPA